MNNITQHVILPNRWKLGQYKFNGTAISGPVDNSLTHWFPISTASHTLFYLEPNAVSLYGRTLGFSPSSISSTQLFEGLLDDNYNVMDSTSPTKPSKPFTYILIK